MTHRTPCCPDFAEALKESIDQEWGHKKPGLIIDDYGTFRFSQNGMIVKFCPWCATQWDFGMKPLAKTRPEEHGAS